MAGWDSHVDHDFYVRAYSDRLESKRFLVSRYAVANKHTRIFKIQGTRHNVSITRSPGCTYSYTISVPEHILYYQDEVSTPDIVCMALTNENFILVPDDVDTPTLF
ncbi:hypothetical protein AV1_gp03 [Actinomyces phage Av-1]|uniref:Uncharacterized protein n=1 Tax=Actinomyces phage Av-1 TaxID=2880361 RepID=A6XAC9_9CAUD|nr:hypothetical protein AV1_gp03 [Actinomyces phage Av-1]ABR67668.1 hypothetical protein [Actinomyces phage Av-1]